MKRILYKNREKIESSTETRKKQAKGLDYRDQKGVKIRQDREKYKGKKDAERNRVNPGGKEMTKKQNKD
jgi:hypothetical protein